MKFKENAIKLGMVIRCLKEEDARALLEYLGQHSYWWKDGESLDDKTMLSTIHQNFTDGYDFYCGIGFRKDDLSRTVTLMNGNTPFFITEFSDLIEPDENLANKANDLANSLDNQDNDLDNQQDNEMSAVEVLEWLHNVDADTIYKVFGISRLDEALTYYEVGEIIQKITTYEAEKKEKPIELKWVNVVRIVQMEDSGDGWYVYEEELPPGGAKKIPTEEILRKYIADHDGNYYATIERRCRVKGE